MKGSIIIPTFYHKRHLGGVKSQRARFLFKELEKKYGLSITYTDSPSLKGLDVAVVYAVPYHNRPKIPSGLLEAKAKLIGYYEDLQCWDNEECKRNKRVAFARYDVLMGACYEMFMNTYSQHLYKHEHFPNFFVPHQAYVRLKPNKRPKMRCLMAGTVSRHYPFRLHIKNRKDKLIDVKRVSFDKYPQFLNSYFCALAVPGRMRNVAAKYLEIPAAGTLMLAARVKELDVMGLKPYVHYVPVTEKNVFGQVKRCLSHPEDFVKIRNAGMDFVRSNHSVKNRIAQFGRILKGLEN